MRKNNVVFRLSTSLNHFPPSFSQSTTSLTPWNKVSLSEGDVTDSRKAPLSMQEDDSITCSCYDLSRYVYSDTYSLLVFRLVFWMQQSAIYTSTYHRHCKIHDILLILKGYMPIQLLFFSPSRSLFSRKSEPNYLTLLCACIFVYSTSLGKIYFLSNSK
jgi:hypothetical protein